jgi:two-component system alkaline phosphatase synthesis response regulator PhoP
MSDDAQRNAGRENGGKRRGAERILIIEDDKAILAGLKRNLGFEGFDVATASDGEEGLAAAFNGSQDLIILDIMLPKVSGFEICRLLKQNKVDTPVIILSAKGQEADKVKGLDLGADDYIAKPFGVKELIARVNAVLRRKRRDEDMHGSCTLGAVEIDFKGQSVRRRKKRIEMSAREFKLLKFLIDNEGKVLDRNTILNHVWGYDYYGTARTVDNFINRLRRKIEDDPNNPKFIVTVFGVGYKLETQ